MSAFGFKVRVDPHTFARDPKRDTQMPITTLRQPFRQQQNR